MRTEKEKAYAREWRKKNREKCRRYTRESHKRIRLEQPARHLAKRQRFQNKYIFGGNMFKTFKRDNYSCQICGMGLKEHLKKFNHYITIHHRDGNKKNNKMSNLVTICMSCHSKIGVKRKLSYEQVVEIRKIRAKQRLTCKQIAQIYNVTYQNIHLIISNRTWL